MGVPLCALSIASYRSFVPVLAIEKERKKERKKRKKERRKRKKERRKRKKEKERKE